MVLIAGQQLPGSYDPSICCHHGDASKGRSTVAAWLYTLLVVFLSKLLITHYLYVTRLIDISLRNQYGCG